MVNIHTQKKYIIYNIHTLTNFCSKYTIYLYFENFGKYTIYNILLPQKSMFNILSENNLKIINNSSILIAYFNIDILCPFVLPS